MTDAEGISEKTIFSNLIVKSKSPRQPTTAGSIAPSLRHPEKSISKRDMRSLPPGRETEFV